MAANLALNDREQGTFCSRRYGCYKDSHLIILLSMALRRVGKEECVIHRLRYRHVFKGIPVKMASTYDFFFPPDTPMKFRT